MNALTIIKLGVGLALAAALTFLYLKWDAADARADLADRNAAVALDAANKSKEALDILKGQHLGAEQVAAAVSRVLEDQRAATAAQNRRTYSAPLEQNNVVPGSLDDTYQWLWQRRQNSGAAAGAGGAAGTSNDPQGGVPGAPANAAPQRSSPKRRAPSCRDPDRADRRRRPLPYRRRRLEGLGHLHETSGEERRGNLFGA